MIQREKLFVTAAIFYCTAAFLVANCRTTEATTPPPSTRPTDHARWMEDRLPSLGSRTLRQLVLPASHDSAMYLTGFPQSLARTQNLSIYGQLSAGVRYFDLRPRLRNNDLYMFHGPVDGPRVVDVLTDIRRFMNEGHRELVILKFSHYDRFSAASYAALINDIKQNLGTWLFTALPAGKRLADIKLAEYVRSTGVVLVVCDENYPITQPTPGIWVYCDWDRRDADRGDLRVFDQYSNTISFTAMKADQIQKFRNFDGRCRKPSNAPCELFLLSWTLTPPTNVPAFALGANHQLGEAIRQLQLPNGSGQIPNLLYTDCVDTNVTDVTIRANQRLSPSR